MTVHVRTQMYMYTCKYASTMYVSVLQHFMRSQQVSLTEEEKETLRAEGLPIPTTLPLTKVCLVCISTCYVLTESINMYSVLTTGYITSFPLSTSQTKAYLLGGGAWE